MQWLPRYVSDFIATFPIAWPRRWLRATLCWGRLWVAPPLYSLPHHWFSEAVAEPRQFSAINEFKRKNVVFFSLKDLLDGIFSTWLTNHVRILCSTWVNYPEQGFMSTWHTWYNTSCVLSRIFCWLRSSSVLPPLPGGSPYACGICAVSRQFQSYLWNCSLRNV